MKEKSYKKDNFIIKDNNIENSFNLEELLNKSDLRKLKEVINERKNI